MTTKPDDTTVLAGIPNPGPQGVVAGPAWAGRAALRVRDGLPNFWVDQVAHEIRQVRDSNGVRGLARLWTTHCGDHSVVLATDRPQA